VKDRIFDFVIEKKVWAQLMPFCNPAREVVLEKEKLQNSPKHKLKLVQAKGGKVCQAM
jgi:hypothetical protein